MLELEPEAKALVDFVKRRFDLADQRAHRSFRIRCDEQYALYNNYDSLKARLRENVSAAERERLMADASNMFGATMFIPFIFSTVETMLPRLVANNPRPRLRPLTRDSEENARYMGALMSVQMRKMRYALNLQDTGKTGLMHGLGVRKAAWVKTTRDSKRLINNSGEWGEAPYTRVLYDDPYIADIDPRDFIWDPFGSSVETCEWAIHRTWRSDDYVKQKFATKDWRLPRGVEMDDAMKLNKDDEYESLWAERAKAGLKRDMNTSDSKVHEIWEYHDGARIVTIFDREIPVAERDNPHWHGELPFSIYRPISKPGEMVGFSVIDALEDLNIELNTMRSQRRDNASQALETPFVYQIGRVDPAHIAWGRGYAFGVNGDPREVIQQMRVNEIPFASFQEENAMKDDIQRTGGVLDIAGGSSTSETATGAQLVYTEANQRIRNMVLRLEEETIAQDMAFVIQMNQQHKLQFEIQLPAEAPGPGEPDRCWTWHEGDPSRLQGEWLAVPEPNSTAAENTPQMRSDFALWGQMLMNPYVDKRRATLKQIECLGVDEPENYMLHEEQVPKTTVDEMGHELERLGGDPAAIEQARQAVMQQFQQQQPQPAGAM